MINILITGAGSVMGQSIYQALNRSRFVDDISVVFTNSDEFGAGLYFNYQDHYKVKISKTYTVPLAVDDGYIKSIEAIVENESIDIVFSGTQHELMKIAAYNKSNCGVLPVASIEVCLDKFKCFEFFRENDIAFPYTTMFNDAEKDEGISFPFIVKPVTDSSSRNIFIVKNNEDIQDIKNTKGLSLESLIAQQYLDGDEYTCGCYVDKISKKLSTIVMKRQLTADGASGFGEVIFNDSIEKYLTDITNMLLKTDMEYGHFNVQLRMVNNEPVCFEINPRLSSTESPKASFGYNSVEAYLTNIVENKEYKDFDVKSGKFIRYYEDVIIP